MRIAYIAAGAGGMYCGACARDINLVRGLIARGHDVQVIPLYTPLRLDGGGELPLAPIHYGGINVFLQQLSPLFRHLPRVLARRLDHPALLNWAGKFAVKTRPQELGAMTVSVLAGRDGRQSVEMERLVHYLAEEVKPDLVSITNTLLSSLAPALKRALGVPVVCSLQGEESFIEAIPEPFRTQAQQWMVRHAKEIDLFFSPGEVYATQMAEFLQVPPQRIRVVRAGVDAQAYRVERCPPSAPFVLGYLSAITPSKGIDLLLEAVRRLVVDQKRELVLRVAGKVLREDYWREQQDQWAALGLTARVEYLGEVDFAGKVAFLQGCSAYTLPSRIAESRGMAVMEAMAAGVPVVVPESGVFPEMMALTEGGLLFPTEDVAALAAQLAWLMDHPAEAAAMGQRAAAGIALHFSAEGMAEGVLAEYSRLVGEADRALAVK